MGNRTWTRAGTLIACLLLIGAVLFGFSFLKRRAGKPAPAEPAAQTDTAEIQEGSRMGPFLLRLTYPKIGNAGYISFHVYYLHDGAEELWYSCGRMFPAADTLSIDWIGTQYDIAVTMKNGKQELFSYDGSSSWQ